MDTSSFDMKGRGLQRSPELAAARRNSASLGMTPRADGQGRLRPDKPLQPPAATRRGRACSLGVMRTVVESYKVMFHSLDWQAAMPGARFKAYVFGERQMRLVEL